MFRFGFDDPAGGENAADAVPKPEEEMGSEAAQVVVEAIEVPSSEGKPTGYQDTVLISSQLSLIKGVISNGQAAELLADDRVASNDLIAGVYEGGFKSWEGGVDLAQFLAAALNQQQQQKRRKQQEEREQQHAAEQPAAQQQAQEQREQLLEQDLAAKLPPLQLDAGTRVMELGCGHGLPGLVALSAGAEVHFQDYNRSVLSTLTIPNVAANASAWATRRAAAAMADSSGSGGLGNGAAETQGPSSASARYFAGSWDSLPGLLEGLGLAHSYDLVLTAETIYSLEAIHSLYRCIKACLRPGTGVAYVAAKSYYFGVGGGTAAFRRLVEEGGIFSCRTVAVVDDGASNKREILELSPRQQ